MQKGKAEEVAKTITSKAKTGLYTMVLADRPVEVVASDKHSQSIACSLAWPRHIGQVSG